MKPMLAATIEDVKQLKFPLYGSPKLDGVRALITGADIVSRNLKPIPNWYVRRELPVVRLGGWDGELIVGKPTDKDVFRNTTSGVMSAEGEPKFTFYVFDYIPKAHIPYEERYKGLRKNIEGLSAFPIQIVPQVKLNDSFELHQYEELMLSRGYEGVMLRSMDGIYKFGRSTLKEGYLMKLKRFADSEAIVLRIVEQMHNANEAKRNKLGQLERSSHKANKIGKATMGALRVVDIHSGVEFDIGTGFDDGFRQAVWDNPKLLLKKTIKYKYFPTGSKDKPRFPVYLGIRMD